MITLILNFTKVSEKEIITFIDNLNYIPSSLRASLRAWQSTNITTFTSDYKLTGYPKIDGLNIGCQCYKYINNYKQDTIIIYNLDKREIYETLQILLAIVIEIEGLSDVEVFCVYVGSISKGPSMEIKSNDYWKSPLQILNVNGKTYKQILKQGKKPYKCLKDSKEDELIELFSKLK